MLSRLGQNKLFFPYLSYAVTIILLWNTSSVTLISKENTPSPSFSIAFGTEESSKSTFTWSIPLSNSASETFTLNISVSCEYVPNVNKFKTLFIVSLFFSTVNLSIVGFAKSIYTVSGSSVKEFLAMSVTVPDMVYLCSKSVARFSVSNVT